MNYEMIADELLDIAETGFRKNYRNVKKEYFTPENLVLIRLARSNEGIVYAGTLSSYSAVATSRMAVILNDLERQGLVERKTDDRDSRKKIVVATPKGKEKGVALLEEIRSTPNIFPTKIERGYGMMDSNIFYIHYNKDELEKLRK